MIEERRNYNCLVVQMVKVIRNIAPPILIELLLNTIAQQNQHRMRNSRALDIPQARTEAYM